MVPAEVVRVQFGGDNSAIPVGATSVPPKFQDRFSKSEKGIDIEICCDALKLASASRIERLFLLTNDDDFIPFCRTIKEFGANISIIHLSETVNRNVSLLREVDSYDVVSSRHLQQMFLPIPEAPIPGIPTPQSETLVSALKPEAEPSDMRAGVELEALAETDPGEEAGPLSEK